MEDKKKIGHGRATSIEKKREGQLGHDYEGRPGTDKQRRHEGRPWRQQKQDLMRMDINDLRDYLLDTEM